MSRAAQAVAQAVREMNVQPRKGRRRMDDETTQGPAPDSPAAGTDTADAATTAAGDDDMTKAAGKRTRKAVPPAAPHVRKLGAKRAKKEKAAKPAREARTRDPLAGLRAKPKLAGVLLGTPASRAIVTKALKALDASALTAEEQHEVTRLLARLSSRPDARL